MSPRRKPGSRIKTTITLILNSKFLIAFTMVTWRLLDTPPMTAAQNMALDETLVELKGEQKTPDTVHFLQFKPRSVLVGYHQSVQEEIRTQYCREHNIEINRRVTGGGAIFFDENQLGWEVICDKAFFNLRLPTGRLFRRLCDPVVTALARLGVQADFRPRNDIEVKGRKISGTGGTESEEAFLFQGTMLVDFDVDTMLKALRIPVEKLKAKEIDSVKERVTCLNWELGYTPTLEQIKAAIQYGFEKHLDIKLEPGGLTAAEEKLFREKLARFQSDDWINRVNPTYQKREVVQAAYKTGAGLVRFTLVVNLPQKRLKDIYITGDFLSFPPRALYDLEADLRGMPLDREQLRQKIDAHFQSGRMQIPGMTSSAFSVALEQALEKVAISRHGLTLEHCNQICVTNGSFEEVIRRKPSVLLLPYCAKLTDCDLRYAKACRACGDCSVGPAWALGLRRKMKLVCVTSFEDLMAELRKMRDRGARAFIGCCCQPFFIKHMDDFKKAGVPGILLDIDNTTCYDLDQAREAYAGKFESQTELNLELLNKVIDLAIKN